VRLLGRSTAVDRLWTSLLSLPPDPVQPQESLDRCSRGRAAAMEGQYVEAEREYRNALKYSPAYRWCTANLAEVRFVLGHPAEAEELLREAIAGYPARLDGLRSDAKGRLASLLVARGQGGAEAVALARAALAARGEQAAVLEALALACDATGDVACARDAWQRLLARPHLAERTRARAAERIAALPPSSPTVKEPAR
jgi:tetratricopeptide (TPR) repeat protein